MRQLLELRARLTEGGLGMSVLRRGLPESRLTELGLPIRLRRWSIPRRRLLPLVGLARRAAE